MKRVIIILLTAFIVNSSMAETSALPTYEQAIKLIAAAWKSPPQSIDVTYYLTVKDNTRTEEKLRQIYKEAFDEMYGPDEELSSEMLEQKEIGIQMNVDDCLAEQQQGGIKVKHRVRFDGNHYRIDKVYERPDKIVQIGTAQEEILPGKKLNANTPFEETFIETQATTNGFELYTYYHKRKIATIEKIKSSPKTIENDKFNSILKMPNASIFKMKLGTRNNKLVTEPYDINEAKIKQLCSGTLDRISVKIKPDENEPNEKDKIEISLYNKEKVEFLTSLIVCAKDDYSKVYYCQTPSPDTGKPPIFTRKCSNFDAQGIPHNVTQVIYDGKGNIQLQETYQVEDIHINIPIPKEIFEFNPPEGYEVTDFRLTNTQRQVAEIESKKRWLKDENWTRRVRALIALEKHLKNDPAELKGIAISMLEDERNDVRAVALSILTRVLRETPEELRRIAALMQDDEDPKIQKMAANILKQIESNNDESK